MAVVKRAVLLALFTIAMFDPTDTRIPFMLGEVVSGRAFTDFYVTATGNSAGDCSVGDPCTLTRAVARCTAGAITGGDTVHIAAGRYTTASRLTISCSGSVGGNYVKWIADDNAQFVPGVVDADTLTWSQTAGRTYTYQATWDEVAAGISLNAMVHEPGHDMPAIEVDEGALGLDSKDYTITAPPRYRAYTSVESVELQSCSFYNDTANNLIYIHLCDGTAPDSAANLWLQTSSSGTFEVTGDYLWFENWHAYSLGGSQVGFSITTASNGGYMTGMDFHDTQLRAQGTNWTITQSDFYERTVQGVPTDTGCTEIASSLTRSGTTATFDSTTSILTNQMKTGMAIYISGVTEAGWNGRHENATVVDSNTITWTIDSGVSATTSTTGTIYLSRDTNVSFGGHECWHNQGGGQAVEIGVEGATTSFGNTFSNNNVLRSWNGIGASGGGVGTPNIIQDTFIWGIPNHGLSITGSNLTVTRVIVDNSQESFYMNEPNIDNVSLTYSIFPRGQVAGHDLGDGSNGWTITHNIMSTLTMHASVAADVVLDCNLYIPSYTGTDNTLVAIRESAGESYTTIAQIQAAQTWEDNGYALAYTEWANQFTNYTVPATVNPNYHPLNSSVKALHMPAACGARIGPYDVQGSADAGHSRRQLRLRRPV
jgi:hypothetical protein